MEINDFMSEDEYEELTCEVFEESGAKYSTIEIPISDMRKLLNQIEYLKGQLSAFYRGIAV